MNIFSLFPFVIITGLVALGSFVFFLVIRNKKDEGFEFTSENLFIFYLYFVIFISSICLAFGLSFIVRSGIAFSVGAEFVSKDFVIDYATANCEDIVDFRFTTKDSEARAKLVKRCEEERTSTIAQQNKEKLIFWKKQLIIGLILTLLSGLILLFHLKSLKKIEKTPASSIVERLFSSYLILFFGVMSIATASLSFYLMLQFLFIEVSDDMLPPGDMLSYTVVFVPFWIIVIRLFWKNLQNEKFKSFLTEKSKIDINVLTNQITAGKAKSLRQTDPEIAEAIELEEERQTNILEMNPSINYPSTSVIGSLANILHNEYSEGFPGKRYFEEDFKYIRAIEIKAQERARDLFKAEYANVQPLSSSNALFSVMLGVLEKGDTLMSLSPDHGGALSYGLPANVVGKVFNVISYGVDLVSGRIKMETVKDIAIEYKPRLILAGFSMYTRNIEWYKFREIAQSIGAICVADIGPISGLIAGQHLENPVPFFDIVVASTHKTLRGPHGAIIFSKNTYSEAIEKAIFPGLQNGLHDHITAAKAVALREANDAEFHSYTGQVINNAQHLVEDLKVYGFNFLSDGTDNHLIIIDTIKSKNISAKSAVLALDEAGISTVMHLLPGDTRSITDPSGISLGTAAITTRGLGNAEMRKIAQWMNEILTNPFNTTIKARIREEVREMCQEFPIPGITKNNTSQSQEGEGHSQDQGTENLAVQLKQVLG